MLRRTRRAHRARRTLARAAALALTPGPWPHLAADAEPRPGQEAEGEAEDVPMLTGSSKERDTKESPQPEP